MPDLPELPDAELVADMIATLSALTEEDYARWLGDNLVEEHAVDTAAFRSPELVERTWAALRALLASTQKRLNNETDRQRKQRTQYFVTRASQERRIVEAIRDGLRAQRGILSAAPNPRARAARELQRNHPVEYLELVRKHEQAIIDERRARRAEQRGQRRPR